MSRCGYIVAARPSDAGIEIRCGLCAQWWPATDEFYRIPTRCIACQGEVRLLAEAARPHEPWDPSWTYEDLARLRNSLPARLVTLALRRATRRAYWREFKQHQRAVAA